LVGILHVLWPFLSNTFWGKVRRCYLKMAKEHEEFLLIDGTKSIEEMQEKIIEEFEKRYGGDNSGH
ncbi:MAG TPA: hypothetical protein PKW84_04725, partial [Fervidobacterium sp.]|nr:hypothetical protein [Fervidobacterium sp.]